MVYKVTEYHFADLPNEGVVNISFQMDSFAWCKVENSPEWAALEKLVDDLNLNKGEKTMNPKDLALIKALKEQLEDIRNTLDKLLDEDIRNTLDELLDNASGWALIEIDSAEEASGYIGDAIDELSDIIE